MAGAKWICIAIGGAVGAVARAAVSHGLARWLGKAFPFGTLCVNLSGALLIGLSVALLERLAVSNEVRLLIVVGGLGAFTTFSTFSFEALALLEQDRWAAAAAYVLGSCAAGIGLVWLGLKLGRAIAG